MAIRTDVQVLWELSPRIIKVLAPSTSISIQDLVDTCRYNEMLLDNMDDPYLIAAAGKEQLGGGVKVGVTATLNNAQVQFEERNDSIQTATVTSDNGVNLISAGALFVTNGVERGATIINITDNSSCTVIDVVSETELIHTALQDGIGNTFDPGDTFKIWNEIQCAVEGGNLVAIDDLGADLNPIVPSAHVQVVRSSSSSATLQEITAIQYSSFNGGVMINTGSPHSGTDYPVGTLQAPVNNLADAITIANVRGFDKFYLASNLTIPNGVDISDREFEGMSIHVSLVLNPNVNAEDVNLKHLTVSGVNAGDVHAHNCNVNALTCWGGVFEDCTFYSTLTMSGTPEYLDFIDCIDGLPGNLTPTLDFNNKDVSFIVRGYTGGIIIKNKSGASDCSIDLKSGYVKLENTVTNGDFIIRGIGTVENLSTGATTVDTTDLLTNASISSATWSAQSADYLVAGTKGKEAFDTAKLVKIIMALTS